VTKSVTFWLTFLSQVDTFKKTKGIHK